MKNISMPPQVSQSLESLPISPPQTPAAAAVPSLALLKKQATAAEDQAADAGSVAGRGDERASANPMQETLDGLRTLIASAEKQKISPRTLTTLRNSQEAVMMMIGA